MTVIHKTFGTGTVISQDNQNVTIDFRGEIKTLVTRFAGLTNEDGTLFGDNSPVKIFHKSRGQKKREKDAKALAAFNELSNLDKIKNSIMAINGKVQGDRNSLGYQLISERLSGIWIVSREKGDTKIADIVKSVEQFMRASEKQAYVLAKFADDNGIKYEDK